MEGRAGQRGQDDHLGEWEDEVERRPGHLASVVFSVRFSRPEIAAVRQAAARVGERTSEFIRAAALARARGGVGVPIDLVASTSFPPDAAILLILFAKPGPKTEAVASAQYIAA